MGRIIDLVPLIYEEIDSMINHKNKKIRIQLLKGNIQKKKISVNLFVLESMPLLFLKMMNKLFHQPLPAHTHTTERSECVARKKLISLQRRQRHHHTINSTGQPERTPKTTAHSHRQNT